MKKNWMAELTYHYEKTRRRYPQDRLMILFDIDGTILDMRYMVFHVLKAFDKKHDTHFFRKLNVSDITVHENQVDSFLAELRIPSEEQREIMKWYNQHRWSSEYILQSTIHFLESLRLFDGSNSSQIPLLA